MVVRTIYQIINEVMKMGELTCYETGKRFV